jgi:DNA end-binding protein Ku
MVDLATQLITKKSAPFDAAKFEDHYQVALKELVQAKLKGRKLVVTDDESRPKGANVVDLMEALKRSIGQSGSGGSTAPAKPAAATPAKAKPAPKTPRGKKSA